MFSAHWGRTHSGASFSEEDAEVKGEAGGSASGATLSPQQQELNRIFAPILTTVMRARNGAMFSAPVVELWPEVAEEYLSIVTNPRDLGTVLDNVENGEYASPQRVLADTRLVFDNARSYNGAESYVGGIATSLEKVLDLELTKALINTGPGDVQERSIQFIEEASDFLSALSAHKYCLAVLTLPTIAEEINAGRWSHCEDLAKRIVSQEVREERWVSCVLHRME